MRPQRCPTLRPWRRPRPFPPTGSVARNATAPSRRASRLHAPLPATLRNRPLRGPAGVLGRGGHRDRLDLRADHALPPAAVAPVDQVGGPDRPGARRAHRVLRFDSTCCCATPKASRVASCRPTSPCTCIPRTPSCRKHPPWWSASATFRRGAGSGPHHRRAPGKLAPYESWGFLEVWVEVPDAPSPSRPRARQPGLTIHLLEDGRYRAATASRAFPGWRAVEIHVALNETTPSARTSATVERVEAVLGAHEGTGPDDDPLLCSQRHQGCERGCSLVAAGADSSRARRSRTIIHGQPDRSPTTVCHQQLSGLPG